MNGTRMIRELETGKAEARWLASHGQRYAGQWAVVKGENLFAAGTDAKVLYDQARAAGIEEPFLVRVPSQPEQPFGGW